MLIGFFKDPEKCICSIIKYADRIWLTETGDAEILRTFVVKVDKSSAEPLREVRLLLPFKHIRDLKTTNGTCFMSSDKYHFNSPRISTMQNYKIIQKPPTPIRYDSIGTIEHDGIKDIRIFALFDKFSSYRVGDCTVIRLQFPCALEKGESTEIRLTFKTTSLFTKITEDKYPIYFVQFTYFSPNYIDEIAQLRSELEIKVRPTLGEDKLNRRIGGFDSIIYFPPGFEKASDFKPYKETVDSYNIQGKKVPKTTLKLIYRLRAALKAEELTDDALTGIGQEMIASGTLTKRHDVAEPIIDGLDNVKKKIDYSTLVGRIAIFMATISIIISIINIFIK